MKKTFALVLAMVMAVSLLSTAHASYVSEVDDPESYYFGEELATESYVNENNVTMICEVRNLSSAQKIAALAEIIYPVNRLEEELTLLERMNDVDHARYDTIYSGKDCLDAYLSEDTRSALSVIYPKTTEELLAAVKKMPEYATDPDLKQIVDGMSQNGLSGAMVRWALKVLTGSDLYDSATMFDTMSLTALIRYAHTVLETDEYQALLRPLAEVRRGNADNYALTCRYTTEELDSIWEELATAARVYWPGYVKMLDEIRFVVPVEQT